MSLADFFQTREQPLQWRPTDKTTEFSWFTCYRCEREGRTPPSYRHGTELAWHLASTHGWPMLRAMQLVHDLERDRQEFLRSELQRAAVGMRPRINIPKLDWKVP
jgi:hypothetical protein